FQERMEEIAMKMSYDDGRDVIYGSLQSLSENLDQSAELLSLALSKPRFDQDAIERIRRQLLANLAFASKNPQQIATKAWFKTAFGSHPYGQATTGTLESVRAIGADDLKAFVKANFAQDNLRVVAVGDISPERLGALLDTVFGGLPEKATLKPVGAVALPDGGKQKVIELDVPQSVAIFGLPALARKDPDFIPAFVLNHILGGGGFSSKLMEEVREKRGLAYSVYSYLNPLDHSAIMQGSVATKNEAIAESLTVIRGELEKIATDGVSAEDLKAAKDYLTGSYALRFDSNSKIASQLLGIRIEELGVEYVETRNSQIEAVGLEDIKRAAGRFLDPDDLITVIVGKPEGVEVRG
ncbi:MAG: pitrilysin family protein, partial [Pseudomonadota bacterium]